MQGADERQKAKTLERKTKDKKEQKGNRDLEKEENNEAEENIRKKKEYEENKSRNSLNYIK